MALRTLALWIAAFVLATVVLVAHFRREHVSSFAPTPVLVAKRSIPSGTPWSVIVSKKMYAPTILPYAEVRSDSVSDPQDLAGKTARSSILAGSQLSKLDFSAKQK